MLWGSPECLENLQVFSGMDLPFTPWSPLSQSICPRVISESCTLESAGKDIKPHGHSSRPGGSRVAWKETDSPKRGTNEAAKWPTGSEHPAFHLQGPFFPVEELVQLGLGCAGMSMCPLCLHMLTFTRTLCPPSSSHPCTKIHHPSLCSPTVSYRSMKDQPTVHFQRTYCHSQ